MKQEYSAGIIVYYKEQTKIFYLLLHYAGGHWDFPKGHLEQGETEEQAAIRELKEETGLTTVALDPNFREQLAYFFYNHHIMDKIHKTVTFFIGEVQEKTVTLSVEHIGFTWLSYEDALARVTFKNAQDVLSKANNYLIRK